MIPESPASLLEFLSALLPGFAAEWDVPENPHRDEGGTFTACGVLSVCGWYVRDHFAQLSAKELTRLGEAISSWLGPDDVADAWRQDLDEAAATCFLENLSYEPLSEALGRHLSGPALAYFGQFLNAGPGAEADSAPS